MSQKSFGFKKNLFFFAVIAHLLTCIGPAMAAGPSGSQDLRDEDQSSTTTVGAAAGPSDAPPQTPEIPFAELWDLWAGVPTEPQLRLLLPRYLSYVENQAVHWASRESLLVHLMNNTTILEIPDFVKEIDLVLWKIILCREQTLPLRERAAHCLWAWETPQQNESRERLLNACVEILLDTQEPERMHFYANGLLLKNVITPNLACPQFFYRSARPDSVQRITWDSESLEELFYGILLDRTRPESLRRTVIYSLSYIGNVRLGPRDQVQFAIVDEEGKRCSDRLIGHLQTIIRTNSDPLRKEASHYLWKFTDILTVDMMPFVLWSISELFLHRHKQAVAFLRRGDDVDQALGIQLQSWKIDMEREDALNPQPLYLDANNPILLQTFFKRYIRPILPEGPTDLVIQPSIKLLGLYHERAEIKQTLDKLYEEFPEAFTPPTEAPEAAAASNETVPRTALLLPLVLREVVLADTDLRVRQEELGEHLRNLEEESGINHDDLSPQGVGDITSEPSEGDEDDGL